MCPILSTEVRARLRTIFKLTVQMTQDTRPLMQEARRQISPVLPGEQIMRSPLGGRFHACMRKSEHGGLTPGADCAAAPQLRSTKETSDTAVASVPATQPRVAEAVNMHTCNHTKKFISYKSHFPVDAKYLIMANAETPVGPRKCHGAIPVFRCNQSTGMMESIWKQQNQ
jgi:hypothetical protein